MFGMLWKITVLIVVSCVKDTLACSCFPLHPQAQFCASSFVIKAKAIDKEYIKVPGEFFERQMVKYIVKILEAYKFNGTQNCEAISILTEKSSAACGVYMEIGSEYLLAGHEENGQRTIHSCSMNQRWEYVQNCTKHYLSNNIYSDNCERCTIKNCFGKECKAKKNECVDDRKSWNSVCEPKRIGYYGSRCSWTDCEYEKTVEPITGVLLPKKVTPSTTTVPPSKTKTPITTDFPFPRKGDFDPFDLL